MDKYFNLIKKFFESPCFEVRKTEATLRSLFKQLAGNEIALSLNGGKDSTVVLFITLYFIQICRAEGEKGQKLKCVYMKEKDPFKEIVGYLETLKSSLDIELYEYDNSKTITPDFMKHALTEFVNTHNIKAVISGTRSTDPYSQNLDLITRTDVDKGWPDTLRVMPIYMWTYEQIWSFILQNDLPFCSLYNLGYTYVGDRENSIPNPFLYSQPAWEANDNIELFSRTSLYNKLARKDNKLFFNQENVLLIVVSNDVSSSSINADDFNIISQNVANFEAKQEYLIDISKIVPVFTNEDSTAVRIKTCHVIEMKRKPGNYDKLYLTIVYSQTHKAVLYVGF